MKLFFLTSGLLATTFACPWLICQEPSSQPSQPAVQTTVPAGGAVAPANVQVQRLPQGVVIDTTAPGPGYPAVLPPAITERRQYEYDWTVGGQGNGPVVARYQQGPNGQDRQAFAKAFAAYQAAQDEETRSKAAEELKTGLGKQYDSFIEGQAKQIVELEERLAKLKEQLEKRRAAKERMVELKLQMVLSQAEGLGFPDAGPPNAAFFYGDALAPVAIPPGVPQYPNPYPNSNPPQGGNRLFNQPGVPAAPLAPAQATELPATNGGGE